LEKGVGLRRVRLFLFLRRHLVIAHPVMHLDPLREGLRIIELKSERIQIQTALLRIRVMTLHAVVFQERPERRRQRRFDALRLLKALSLSKGKRHKKGKGMRIAMRADDGRVAETIAPRTPRTQRKTFCSLSSFAGKCSLRALNGSW
jgi:hypothetical protein